MRIHKPKLELDTFLDNNLNDRAEEIFNNLPRFYKSHDGVERFTNIDDACDSISQADWQEIARLLVKKDALGAGLKLDSCLFHICKNQARDELEEEYESNVASGKDEEEAAADMRYQRNRDDELEGRN